MTVDDQHRCHRRRAHEACYLGPPWLVDLTVAQTNGDLDGLVIVSDAEQILSEPDDPFRYQNIIFVSRPGRIAEQHLPSQTRLDSQERFGGMDQDEAE